MHTLRDHIGQALLNAERLENAGVFRRSCGSTIMIPLDYHGRIQSLDKVGCDDPFA
jgi:hypothetical protein